MVAVILLYVPTVSYIIRNHPFDAKGYFARLGMRVVHFQRKQLVGRILRGLGP